MPDEPMPGPTGPLPHNWHRVTFRKRTALMPCWVVSSDVGALTVLVGILERSGDVVPESIVFE